MPPMMMKYSRKSTELSRISADNRLPTNAYGVDVNTAKYKPRVLSLAHETT